MKKLLALALIVALISALILLLRKPRLDQIVQKQLQQRLTGPVDLGRVEGRWPGHLVLHDLVLHDSDGKVAVRIAELELRLDLWSLATRHVKIPLARARGVEVHARRLADGRINLAALARDDQPTTKSFDLPSVEVEGEASWEERVRGAVHAEGALLVAPEEKRVRVERVEAATDRGKLSASGKLRIGGGVDLKDVEANLDAPGWRARLLAHGPWNKLQIEAQGTAPLGQFQGRGEWTPPYLSFTGSGEGQGAALHGDGRIDTDGNGEVRAHFDAKGLHGEAHLTRREGKLHAEAHAASRGMTLAAELDDRALQLRLRGPGVSARAHGQVRQNDAPMALDELRLAWRGATLRGQGHFTLAAEPTLSLRLSGDVPSWNFSRAATPPARIRAQIDYRRRKLSARADARSRSGNVNLTAALPVDLVAALRRR
jgi:uncharacterized protein involved in outer membrane biogenesis